MKISKKKFTDKSSHTEENLETKILWKKKCKKLWTTKNHKKIYMTNSQNALGKKAGKNYKKIQNSKGLGH